MPEYAKAATALKEYSTDVILAKVGAGRFFWVLAALLGALAAAREEPTGSLQQQQPAQPG